MSGVPTKLAQKIKLAKKRSQIGLRPKSKRAKRESGLGEEFFAFLRIKLKYFRFSLNKKNTKQKNFISLLKEKIAYEKIKKYRENFSVFILYFIQKMFEFRSENTAINYKSVFYAPQMAKPSIC